MLHNNKTRKLHIKLYESSFTQHTVGEILWQQVPLKAKQVV